MPSQHDVEMALAYLDELTDRLRQNIRAGGFDNNAVVWLVKGWTKIGIRTQGPGFHRTASAYYVMNRDPTAASGKRSQTLLSALDNYESIVQNNGTTSGDFFQRADRAMLDFVWDYRKHIHGSTEKGHSEGDFVSRLTQWRSLSADQVMQEVVFNMDRSA